MTKLLADVAGYGPHAEHRNGVAVEARRNHHGLDLGRDRWERLGQHAAVFLREAFTLHDHRDTTALLNAAVRGHRANHVTCRVPWLGTIVLATQRLRVDPF